MRFLRIFGALATRHPAGEATTFCLDLPVLEIVATPSSNFSIKHFSPLQWMHATLKNRNVSSLGKVKLKTSKGLRKPQSLHRFACSRTRSFVAKELYVHVVKFTRLISPTCVLFVDFCILMAKVLSEMGQESQDTNIWTNHKIFCWCYMIQKMCWIRRHDPFLKATSKSCFKLYTIQRLWTLLINE